MVMPDNREYYNVRERKNPARKIKWNEPFAVPLDPDTLVMYVIYDNPRDHPGKFVTRMWISSQTSGPMPTSTHSIHDTLDQARSAVPNGMHRIRAMSEDDPCIVETWL